MFSSDREMRTRDTYYTIADWAALLDNIRLEFLPGALQLKPCPFIAHRWHEEAQRAQQGPSVAQVARADGTVGGQVAQNLIRSMEREVSRPQSAMRKQTSRTRKPRLTGVAR